MLHLAVSVAMAIVTCDKPLEHKVLLHQATSLVISVANPPILHRVIWVIKDQVVVDSSKVGAVAVMDSKLHIKTSSRWASLLPLPSEINLMLGAVVCLLNSNQTGQ